MKVWETSEIAFLSHIKIIEKKFVDFFSDEYLLRLYFGGFGDVGARSTKYCIRTPDIIIFRDWILEAKISKFLLEIFLSILFLFADPLFDFVVYMYIYIYLFI